MEQESLDLTKTYLQLVDDGAVKPIENTPDVILDLPDGYRRIALVNCRVGIVPKGIWHRFEVREPGMLVFITAGNGTQHRSR